MQMYSNEKIRTHTFVDWIAGTQSRGALSRRKVDAVHTSITR